MIVINGKCSKCKGDHATEAHHVFWITIEDYLMQKQNIRNKELSDLKEPNRH